MSGDEAVRKESAQELFDELDEIARDHDGHVYGLSYSDAPLVKSLDAIMAYGQASRSAAIQECADLVRKVYKIPTLSGAILRLKDK